MDERRWLFLLPVLVCLAGLWHVHIIDRGMPQSHSDLMPRWVGIRAAFRGEDPYTPGVLRDIQTAYYGRPLTPADERRVDPQGFFYPAYTAIVLGPLALLPWNVARLAFLAVAPPLLVAGLWLCIRALKSASHLAWIATAFTLASWPAIWGLRQQQPTLLTAAFVFLAYFLIVRDNDIPAGALLAASTIKPQLVAPLILWLFLWSVLQRRYKLLVSFTCAMTALLIPTEILIPHWFPHWIHSLTSYQAVGNNALPLVFVMGSVPGLLATVVLVSVSVYVLWRLRFADVQSLHFGVAFSLVLAAALCVTPIKLAIIYNQMLLVPAAVLLFCWKPVGYHANVARCLAIGLFVWGSLAVPLAVIAENILGPSDFWDALSFHNILLPVVSTVALLVQYWDVLQATPSAQPDEFATAMV